MRRFLFFIFISFCGLSAKADTKTATDSLLQIMKTLPSDTTRLALLNSIIKIEQNNYKCIQYSDTLMKEALKQKNDKHASLAAYYHLIYYYNHNQQDSVAKWILEMEPYVIKSGLWDYFFDAKRFQIDLYNYDERYELAISESNKMRKKAIEKKSHRGQVAAYQCLSNAYIGSQRWDKGVETLEKAYSLLTKKDNPVVRISVLTQLVSATKEMKNNPKLLKYLQELGSTLNEYIKANPSLKGGFNDVFLFYELFYSHYLLDTHHPKLANEHLVKSGAYLDENTYFMYRVLYFDTYAKYYQYINEYQQASDYIDTTLTMLKKDFPSDYAEQLLKKARIWAKAGEEERALPLYKQALVIKDSAAITIANTQMEQIKSSYNLDKIELDQKKQYSRILLISLVVITSILIVLFIFMFRLFKVRKALKLSEIEVRKATETVRNANETKNRFLSNMSYNIRTPLNNVVGFSQLIASEPNMEEETRQEYSGIISKSTEKLMKLVNDVLDLSRLEAQMMKFQIQDLDAVELCNEACYMARMRNEQTGIQVLFSTELASQPIRTDSTRLTQALLCALTYPQEYQKNRVIRFTLSKSGEALCFRIANSPLADPALACQETFIRHDINRLLLEHFGGSYQVSPQAPEDPEIVFTYPVTLESE